MSVELGQQSMLEKPQPRSLIVPKGRAGYWGVDSSTRGVAVGWISAAGERGVTEHASRGEGMRRLLHSFDAGMAAAYEAANFALPGLIVVEQPSGSSKQVSHALEFAVGAIVAGILQALSEMGESPAVELVVASWWKARACGNGGIKKTYIPRGGGKPKMLPLEEYAVMKWARLNGYVGMSWDSVDAMAMAEAARSEYALVER